MRKSLSIPIAAIIAINFVIYCRAGQPTLATSGDTPRLLPTIDDAQPLRPNSIAERIQSFTDGAFILTGRPAHQIDTGPYVEREKQPTKPDLHVQQVQYLEAQRTAHQRQVMIDPPRYAPPQSAQYGSRPPQQVLAAKYRPNVNQHGRQTTPDRPLPVQDATFYQRAMLLAHGQIPFGELKNTAPPQQPYAFPPTIPQRPDRAATQQHVRRLPALAPPANEQSLFPVRLAQSQDEVENLLLGDPEVPPPPGYDPPASKDPSQNTDSINANEAVSPQGDAETIQQPIQPVTAPADVPRLRFPDQSPGEYATAPQTDSSESANANPQPPQQFEQLPSPTDNVAEGADGVSAPQNNANTSGISTQNGSPVDPRTDPFAPAPDENLLRPNQGGVQQTIPANSAMNGNSQGNTIPQTPIDLSSTPLHVEEPTNQQSPQQSSLSQNNSTTDPSAASDNSSAIDPHLDVYAKSQFPSARECGECHKQIFEEWSVSNHAYAAISPMFNRFEQTINTLAKGTLGYFCMRCHSPVGTTINHPREESIWDSIPAAHEGITCIACHRVVEHYGKVNGDRRIEPGDINAPVVGSGYGETLRDVLSKKEHYKVKTGPHESDPGQQIHNRVIHFEQISQSEFCVSCHQVTVYPGIALEVVWAQYRASPACKEGISCQDCHMGAVPGKPYGYDTAPVADVGGKDIDPGRKHSNHMFVGPGYSIAHPGVFPFRATKVEDETWTPEQWNQFNYRAGWGTKQFEENLEKTPVRSEFPEVWKDPDDRADARELLEKNLAKLATKKSLRRELMEGSSKIHGPVFKNQPRAGKKLQFRYTVENLSSGHNMPSGSLGAQPQLWVNVALNGPDGQHLWESGYVDCNGDIADMHSLEVTQRRVRPDTQLVNFQAKFLVTHVKGPDREMYLPIPVDADQLPFIRPAGLPITVLNHPPTIRMEAHSIPPLGSKDAVYEVPGELVRAPGVYRLSVRMRSRAEPIYFMKYCRSSPEMERRMNERMLDFHEASTTFVIK